MPTLFEPFGVRNIDLASRTVMAPRTRSRPPGGAAGDADCARAGASGTVMVAA